MERPDFPDDSIQSNKLAPVIKNAKPGKRAFKGQVHDNESRPGGPEEDEKRPLAKHKKKEGREQDN